MKKRTLALIVCFALVLTAVVALAACDKTVKYTVSFYDGTKKINEVQIEDGKTIDADYKPTRDGYTFVGWYDDVSLAAGSEFDVKTPIKADTKLYAKWQSNTVETDTRIWYVMGSVAEASWTFPTTKGDDGKWTVNEGQESQIMTQKEGTNEYSITLTMRPGQKFRFVTGAINADWTGDDSKAEAGLGNIAGFEYAAGTNPEGGAEVTLDSKEYGCVKKDSDVIFEGGKEFNANPKNWNIFIGEGKDGKYKFTLTTYPGEDDRNTVAWELVEELEPLESTCKLVIAGDMNSWAGDDENGIAMTPKDVDNKGEGVYIYPIVVNTIGTPKAPASATAEGEGETPTEPELITKVELKAVNTVKSQWLGIGSEEGKLMVDGSDNNFTITENGTWMFVVDTVNMTYKLEKCAMRVVGTIDGNGWADGAAQKTDGYKDNIYVMTKVEGTEENVEKYEVTLEIKDNFAASWSDWPAGKTAAIKISFCGAGYDVWDYGVGDQGKQNYFFDDLGWYKVTITITTDGDNVTREVTVVETTAPATPAPETPAE